MMHNFLMGPIPDGLEVDHINRSPWDNRRSNLRLITRSENTQNHGLPISPPFPTREEMAEAKTQRAETKRRSKRCSNAAKKRRNWTTSEKPVKDDLGNYYRSAAEAARAIGVPNGGNITAVCRGERPTAYNRAWSYVIPD